MDLRDATFEVQTLQSYLYTQILGDSLAHFMNQLRPSLLVVGLRLKVIYLYLITLW